MSTAGLEATEAVGAAGATHARVTLAQIEDKIVERDFVVHDGLLTLCLVTMANGFVVVGKSAPASPENFDAEKGRTFAYEDAVRQLWPLEGYALRERLAANKE